MAEGRKKLGKTGNAPIKKQGQTTDSKFGSDPDKQSRYGGQTRDLKAK